MHPEFKGGKAPLARAIRPYPFRGVILITGVDYVYYKSNCGKGQAKRLSSFAFAQARGRTSLRLSKEKGRETSLPALQSAK